MKRPLDIDTTVPMATGRAQKKTERSHEENQERAYIAASRRADRSIEARVQSARMASEIHKKRTGKGFKISEEIVMKEEMYEEEEDDLPRHYRALTAHLQTASPDMNSKVNAYVTHSVAMASLLHQQEVNRMFAEYFPQYAAHTSQQTSQQIPQHTSQHVPHSAYYPTGQQQVTASPTSSHFSPVNFQQPGQDFPRERSRSIAQGSDALSPRQDPAHVPSPHRSHGSMDEGSMTTPGLSPSSTEMSGSRRTSSYSSNYTTLTSPIDPGLSLPPAAIQSSFTTELPAGVKQLANIDMNDPVAAALMRGEPLTTDGCIGSNCPSVSIDAPPMALKTEFPVLEDFVNPAYFPHGLTSEFTSSQSRMGTPGADSGVMWETWLNDGEECR
ncbi:hypothetical protein NKR23_g4800 [Pleurostoma richardsiae]|uniref:Uncharacterized protein n=1 Tax=Pleurostoma richardsiae TaxID=41990 RepID=A0AA38VRB7_9PEZI|nr:hypothetical protein NKR23_g4800 [Pleurostoma richardsiae]